MIVLDEGGVVVITEEKVKECLRTVIDPELGIDIVKLGLIYSVKIDTEASGVKVKILMTLTSPGCPLSHVFDSMVRSSLGVLEGIDEEEDVVITLTFDPPWTPEMMSEEARVDLGFE